MRRVISFVFLVWLSSSAKVPAQTAATTDVGPLPFHSYSGGAYDRVQLQNGSMWFKIPLFSLPQLGKTQLSFSLAGHSSSASPQGGCSTTGGCYSSYVDNDAGETGTWYFAGGEAYYGNVRIEHDQALSIASSLVETSSSTPISYGSVNYFKIHKQWRLRDGSGAIHQLGYDSTDYSLLHATDGSGWTVKLPIENSVASIFNSSNPSAIIYAYDSNGIKYSLGQEVSASRDRNGNTVSAIPASSAGQYSQNLFQSLTDSVNRTISLTRTAVSTENCPNLGISDQQVTSSEVWNVPGPNGGTLAYQICYTSFALKTNFWGTGGSSVAASAPVYDDYGNVINQGALDQWVEWSGNSNSIQSVLLPDDRLTTGYRSFWGFIYDTPATGYQYTYGNVVEIRTPEGGNTHYTYDIRSACGPPVLSPTSISLYPRVSNVTSRTVSSGSGPTISTSYAYTSTQTTETTNGNDIQHIFTLDNGGCGGNETETKYFQGGASGNVVLKDVSTTFYSQGSPQDNIDYSWPAPNVNVRPNTVTTQLTGQAANTTTYTYEPLFTDVEPIWDGGSGYALLPSAVMYSTTPTSVSDSISTQSTPSYWSSHPDYKAANLLDLRASVQVTDSSNQQVAYRSFQYDEGNGSPQGVYGNLTSTTYWLGPSGSLSDGTVFNSQGEVVSSSDRRGITAKVNSFQCSGLFPSSVTAAFGTPVAETSSETRDCTTGLVTSRTDSNGVVTMIDRVDPLGRATKVRTAVGTPQETHSAYSYPNRTTITIVQDQNTSDDGHLLSAQSFDGLGRIVSQTAPGNIKVDTTYDNSGQVASVSTAYGSSGPTGYTSFLYDALGRKTMQCNPDNGSGSNCTPGSSYKQWTFTGAQVAIRDERGAVSTQTFDSRGRLTTIVEAAGGATTSYGYDPLGNLTSADQSANDGSRHREFKYDSLTRLIASYNPETGWICYGTTGGQTPLASNCSPQYDGNGNLLAKTDNLGVVSSYTYDALNRLIARKALGSGIPERASCYIYGNSGSGVTNGIGRLIGEWTQSTDCPSTPTAIPSSGTLTSRSITSYDPMGRVKMEVRCVLTHCNSATPQSYSYDLAGDLTSYNDGRGASSFTQSFDAAGRLQAVQRSLGGTQTPVLNILGYDPAGWNNAILGTVLTEKRTFDNRMRVQSEIVRKP